MDHHDVPIESQPFVTAIDIDLEGWDNAEDIELRSDEHDLFLQDSYVRPNNTNILPFKATNMVHHSDRFDGRLSSNRSHDIDASVNDGEQCSTSFQNENTRSGSPSSSIVYQLPNYQQFAGSLGPSSRASVVASFIIVIVILFVTIVPIIMPQSSVPVDSGIGHVISGGNGTKAQNAKVEHADVRCKCICPPRPLSQKDDKSSSTSSPLRRLYVGNTLPNQCNCENIVQAHLKDVKIPLKEFCVGCECRYQSRNTTTIKRNVEFFIILLSALCLYMLVQYLLKYFRITRKSLPRRLKWLSHQLNERG